MFIPWAIMSMPSEVDKRRLNFWIQRKVAHANEQYGWPALPRSSARFMSALQPMQVSNINPRQQWALFPYISGTLDEIKHEYETRVGADIFWRPKRSSRKSACFSSKAQKSSSPRRVPIPRSSRCAVRVGASHRRCSHWNRPRC